MLHRDGRLAEAEQHYLKLLATNERFHPALYLMGLVRLQQARPAEALPYIERALKLTPATADMLSNYGLALGGVGQNEEALQVFNKVVQQDVGSGRAWSNRGAMLAKLHRSVEALADFDRALKLDPLNDDTWTNRGLALLALNRPHEALASFDQSLQIRPGHIETRNNRALALRALGRADEALAEFDRVLAGKPDHAGAWVNRAAVLRARGEIGQALHSYARALEIQPAMPEALVSRANCLWTHKGDVAGAIADLERLVAVSPDYPYARGELVHMQMHAAYWRDLGRDLPALDHGVQSGKRVVEPYVYQALSPSSADLLTCAKIYAQDKYPPRSSTRVRQRQAGKIRLGYVCGEFRAQATMHLAAGLFENHDRARFRVTAFDNSREDGSEIRKRVVAAFDEFVPIQSLSDQDAAQIIATRDIDILINLNGYFGALRMGVFAHRPAPVQVNYLGFPGSLGADYIDYILADAEVIPKEDERNYSEKVARIPGSYQINDDRRPRPIPDARAVHGLNDSDFVFCHFNAPYKITPVMFTRWSRLLEKVPSSVLWILQSNSLMASNLRAEIARAGIDPVRLVFAPPMANAAHIARLALGDLFLDSLPYNAHTTASDALWAGLPLITCRGEAFAGRVAASLLRAAGLPELITNTLEEYESLALKLATDRDLLKSYRDRLNRGPETLPLFDTVRTTRRIEAAYEQMMTRWTAGMPAAGFDVPA